VVGSARVNAPIPISKKERAISVWFAAKLSFAEFSKKQLL
jgi:hypothetical protein